MPSHLSDIECKYFNVLLILEKKKISTFLPLKTSYNREKLTANKISKEYYGLIDEVWFYLTGVWLNFLY